MISSWTLHLSWTLKFVYLFQSFSLFEDPPCPGRRNLATCFNLSQYPFQHRPCPERKNLTTFFKSFSLLQHPPCPGRRNLTTFFLFLVISPFLVFSSYLLIFFPFSPFFLFFVLDTDFLGSSFWGLPGPCRPGNRVPRDPLLFTGMDLTTLSSIL